MGNGSWIMPLNLTGGSTLQKGAGRALLRLETLLSDKIRQLSQRSI